MARGEPSTASMLGEKRKRKHPMGFRFLPTDAEIVCHFLEGKAMGVLPTEAHAGFIEETDIYGMEPWELHDNYSFDYGHADLKEMYFFTPRHRAGSSSSSRQQGGTNVKRETRQGTWKGSTAKKLVKVGSKVIGRKTDFAYELRDKRARSSAAHARDWIMTEYVMYDPAHPHHFQELAVSYIHKNKNHSKRSKHNNDEGSEEEQQQQEEEEDSIALVQPLEFPSCDQDQSLNIGDDRLSAKMEELERLLSC